MCFDTSFSINTEQPWNQRDTRRYKFLELSKNGVLFSPFFFVYTPWYAGEWKEAQEAPGAGVHDRGFHVFVQKHHSFHKTWHPTVAVELEVEGFIAAGMWRDKKCETWKRVKIVNIWAMDGTNITEKFRRKQ